MKQLVRKRLILTLLWTLSISYAELTTNAADGLNSKPDKTSKEPAVAVRRRGDVIEETTTRNETYSTTPIPTNYTTIVPSSPSPSPNNATFIPDKISHIGTLRGTAEGDLFGFSVSLSQTGDVIAIGSPEHSLEDEGIFFAGLVQIYQSNGGDLLHQVTGINEGEAVGYSVSLSGDNDGDGDGDDDGGWVVAYGAPGVFSPENTGYVTIISKDDDTDEQGIKFNGEEKRDQFGASVSLSRNGRRVAIASKNYVRVYEKRNNNDNDDDGWIPLGSNIDNGGFVSRVALSGDGNTLAIGFPGKNSLKGSVSIYRYVTPSDMWVQMGRDIEEEEFDTKFGQSVYMSRNGNRVIIGTDGGNVAKVYEYNDMEWELLGNVITGEPVDCSISFRICLFGYSVSMSDDGTMVVVGSPGFGSDEVSNRGRARVYWYDDDDSEWKQIGDDVVGENGGDEFGWSVSIAGNANVVAVGAAVAENYRGNVHLFEVA